MFLRMKNCNNCQRFDMSYDLTCMDSRYMTVEEIDYVLSRISIFEKLAYSGVSKFEVKAALKYCKTKGQLNTWLESVLAHWVRKYPEDNKHSWDKYRKAKATQVNILHMFENTNLVNNTTYEEIKSWAESE